MIIKGTSRAAPGRLAAHLTRTDANERVEILELQSPLPDLKETFRDWQFLAGATRGKLGLYHANIDPAEGYAMTADQWQRAVNVLEEELGFQGQPRAVVLHEKHGRQHIHAVWQRTDMDTMTLRADGNNYHAHERASQRLETEFGHDHVPGKHAKRDREHQPEPPVAAVSHAEWQQAERTGLNALERKAHVTSLRANCDNAPAFRTALETHGYILAQGDKRALVIVDADGEVFSLSRHVTDLKGKAFKEFMAAIDPATLPTVQEAKKLQSERKDHKEEESEKEEEGKDQTIPILTTPPPPEHTDDLSARERWRIEKALTERHAGESQNMAAQHTYELSYLRNFYKRKMHDKLGHMGAMQQAERNRWFLAEDQRRKSFWGFLDAIQSRWNPQLALEKTKAREKEYLDLKARQRLERIDALVLLKQNRDDDVQALKERHEAARIKHGHQYDKQLDRYLREHDAARHLLEQVQERRRQQEEQRSRDGPEPPTRAR